MTEHQQRLNNILARLDESEMMELMLPADVRYLVQHGQTTELLEQVDYWLNQQKPHVALHLLGPLGGELIDRWLNGQDETDYEPSDLLRASRQWAEALLLGDLEIDSRRQWEGRLIDWAHELGEVGTDYVFDEPLDALSYYWDHPAIQTARHAPHDPKQPADTSRQRFPSHLVALYLRVLQRQQRWQEALCFAYNTAHYGDYVRFLLLQNSTEQLTIALQSLPLSCKDALMVARLLTDQQLALLLLDQQLQQAAETLEHCNRYDYACHEFLHWADHFAAQHQQQAMMLRCRALLLKLLPSLSHYQCLKHAYGTDWEAQSYTVLKAVLPCCAECDDHEEVVQIWLAEQQFAEAMAYTQKVNFDELHDAVNNSNLLAVLIDYAVTHNESTDWLQHKTEYLLTCLEEMGYADEHAALQQLRACQQQFLLVAGNEGD